MHPLIARCYGDARNGRNANGLAAIYDLTELATWEEDKHPRDHGKFSEKAGDKGSIKGEVVKKKSADFILYDGSGYEQEVVLDVGDHGGQEVYRWRATFEGEPVDAGDWTADKDQARQGGKEFADANHKQREARENAKKAKPGEAVHSKADATGIVRAKQNTPQLRGADAKLVADYVNPATTEYVAINRALRQGTAGEHHDKGQRLSALISAIPPLEEPVTVYRGIDGVDASARQYVEQLLAAEPGSEIEHQGLMSTSHNPAIALQFSSSASGGEQTPRVVLEIKARKGMATDAAHDDRDVHEAEFLMAHKARFRVVGKTVQTYSTGGAHVQRVHTVQLEQIA